MKFNREELLGKLDVAKMAADPREFLPILSHFCFDGKNVTAYNDWIGIRVACKSNFRLALQANVLLKLLLSVSTEEVDIGFSKSTVFLKAGPSRTGVRARLPYMGEEDFAFEWPNLKRLQKCEMSKAMAAKFLKGLKLCLSSVGDQMPFQMGVTLYEVGDTLRMYSTNNLAMSRYWMPSTGLAEIENIILPTTFCQAILKAAAVYGHEGMKLMRGRNFAIVQLGSECTMWGKFIANDDPVDFEKVFKQHLGKYKQGRQKVPNNFSEIFQRALLMLTTGDDGMRKTVVVQLAGNTLTVESKSSLGKVKSSAVFKKTWPSREVVVDAELAARAAENCDVVYFGRGAAVFGKGAYTHMVYIKEA